MSGRGGTTAAIGTGAGSIGTGGMTSGTTGTSGSPGSDLSASGSSSSGGGLLSSFGGSNNPGIAATAGWFIEQPRRDAGWVAFGGDLEHDGDLDGPINA